MAFVFFDSPEAYLNLMLIVFLIVPFLLMIFAMPYVIRKLKENGHIVRDMYKKINA